MDESKPNFEWRRGNVDMTVRKTESPIHCDMIDESIKDFLISHSAEGELLKIVEYEVEFFILEDTKGFVKITVLPDKEKTSEINLTGEDLKEFIKLLQDSSGLNMSTN